ncbi:DUF2306 domain-containing protein [Dyella dinghuensis]|uniref:DUF2306 domain-containing protein n=1 Tax=Dyella dinghuensis TaxID=1920169 RepID=A0A432LVF2_9GAMM|nr:DUF2306 domain-containing protein [Dyella dinghuensis]RUL65996.1 DUF2306 domain-containing protein [Dyella dinghuensis]
MEDANALTIEEAKQSSAKVTLPSRLFGFSSYVLAAVTWISCGLFGLYILIFYAGALVSGTASRWNGVLPGLYTASSTASTVGIGLHFAAGGVILALGFMQLLSAIRQHVPAVHRWLGRIYVTAAAVAGVGGLTFIAVTGTIGGLAMNIGFGLYGVLMVLCAVQTYWYARRRELETHRKWAIRLFALAIGSWLYRMEYGFWFLMTHKLGHTHDFHGPFDVVMAFFFYLPNLLVAEAYLRGRSERASAATKLLGAAIMGIAVCLLVVATYFFAMRYWWPAIVTGAAT